MVLVILSQNFEVNLFLIGIVRKNLVINILAVSYRFLLTNIMFILRKSTLNELCSLQEKTAYYSGQMKKQF